MIRGSLRITSSTAALPSRRCYIGASRIPQDRTGSLSPAAAKDKKSSESGGCHIGFGGPARTQCRGLAAVSSSCSLWNAAPRHDPRHREGVSTPTRSSRRLPTSPLTSSSTTTMLFSTLSDRGSNNDDTLELYMWGTDTKGSLLKPKDRADEKILDVPHRVDGATLASFYVSGETSSSSDDNSSTSDGAHLSKVICGATDTAYLLSDGSCYVTGENKNGQLGVGHKNPVTSPVPVVLPPPTNDDSTTPPIVSDLALGPSFAAAVDSLGNLYTCGLGGSVMAGFGMLGHGTADSITSFQQVQSLVEDQCRVRQVQVGESHMAVLTTEGEVLTCGAGSYGRLGNFDTVDQLCLEPVEVLTTDHNIVQIASGKAYTLALTKDGILYGWGRNHQGQLGVGLGLAVDMYAMQNIPEPIETDELVNRRVTKVSAGPSHAACITSGGELFYWGMGLHLEPVRVNALMHTQVVDVVCGKEYTIAMDVDGHLYSFGKGKNGCLGQGGTVKQLHQATRMEAFRDDQTIVQLSAGWDHAACLVRTPVASDVADDTE